MFTCNLKNRGEIQTAIEWGRHRRCRSPAGAEPADRWNLLLLDRQLEPGHHADD
ncbi:MAG: hypothetical protein R3C12_26010 [Planctomycetaceae bacterium]